MEALRQVSRVLGPRRRAKWLLLVILALALSGLEVIGAAAIYLLLSLVTGDAPGPSIPLIGDPRQLFPGASQTQSLLLVTAVIGVFFLIRAGFLVGQSYAQARVVNNACAEVGTRLVRGYLAMPYRLHLERNSAELVRNAFYNVSMLNTGLLKPGVQVAAESLIILGLVLALLAISPLPTVLALVVFGPTVWILLRAVKPRMKAYGHGAKEAESSGLRLLQQGLAGIRELRVFGAERSFAERYGRTRTNFARLNTHKQTLAQVPRALLETMLVLFVAAFFALLVTVEGAGSGALSLLGLFAYVIMRLKPSLQVIVAGVNQIRHSTPSLEDLAADLERCAPFLSKEDNSSITKVPTLRQAIELDGVSLVYDTGERPALEDIHLRIAAGESVGFCGPTGGGKSTLLDIITGLLEPTTGTVRVDGVDLGEDREGWFRQLGVASQNVFILDDTVRNNIALGVDRREIDEAALEDAIRLAQLETVIDELPGGLETRLGERGTRLSGGQRQRVAIARALYRSPSVLIFDEATAALDNQTESELVAALEALQGTRTLITVAHRLTTLRHCDRIFVVESGRITDSGTYEDLLARHPLFASNRASPAITPRP
jgi:ATP-binding cassette, subfamily B, bacterial PglK